MARRSDAQALTAVKVIGLGGIGAHVAQGLMQFLASSRVCPTLVLIDGDFYAERNRDRVLFEECTNKALAKALELGQAARGRVAVLPIQEYVTPKNVRDLIGEREAVFLAVDNHASRKLVSGHCARLRDVLLVSGGNDGVEDGRPGTYGNVQVHVRRRGRNVTSPMTRFHPEIARPADRRPDELDCAELAEAVPQLLFTNLTVAAVMLGTFHAWLTGVLDHEEVYIDIALGRVNPVRRGAPGRAQRRR